MMTKKKVVLITDNPKSNQIDDEVFDALYLNSKEVDQESLKEMKPDILVLGVKLHNYDLIDSDDMPVLDITEDYEADTINNKLLKLCIKKSVEAQELRKKLKEAEQMKQIGQLSGGVIHDLKNILGLISGHASLLVAQDNSLSAVKIKDSIDKAYGMLDDLVTIIKGDNLEKDIVEINNLILNFLNSAVFQELRNNHPDVKLELQLEPDTYYAKANENHLFKALLNLVLNAYQAQENGGKVSISSSYRALDSDLILYNHVPKGKYFVIRVADNGNGTKEIDRIFNPLYSSKNGSGLGLSIVKWGVENNGGYINVVSSPGSGTIFEIYLPVVKPSFF